MLQQDEKKLEKDCIWKEFTNKNGKKFRVGYPKELGYTEENIDAEIAQKKESESEVNASWVSVYWVPEENASWHKPKKAVREKGIREYKLTKKTRVTAYMYKLEFINTKGWYFDFMDESGDEYHIVTPRNGYHYINYNSTDPIIIKVN